MQHHISTVCFLSFSKGLTYFICVCFNLHFNVCTRGQKHVTQTQRFPQGNRRHNRSNFPINQRLDSEIASIYQIVYICIQLSTIYKDCRGASPAFNKIQTGRRDCKSSQYSTEKITLTYFIFEHSTHILVISICKQKTQKRSCNSFKMKEKVSSHAALQQPAAGTMCSNSRERSAPSAGWLSDWLSTDHDVITVRYKGSDK